MEVHELAMKLVGLEEVWDTKSGLYLDENNIPIIHYSYQTKRHSAWISHAWRYVDNKWVEAKDEVD